MTKTAFITIGVLAAGVLGLFIVPIVYDGQRSASQQRALLARTDYPQIAAACVSLARGITGDSVHLKPSDPVVPVALRSLSPQYISAYTNFIAVEFHGGFDHYGFQLHQSDTNARIWSLYYYTEKGQRLLTTITNE